MRVLIQTKSNLVASFQIMDISVSFLKVWSDALVIYQNFIIETPGWNPDSQGAVGGNDLVADRKIIRISCLASDEILVIKLDIAISVKVTVIGCLVGRIRVFSNRSNQSGNVGRAVGTGVPGRAQWFVMQVSCNDTGDPRKHFQGIHKEKAFAVQLHTSQNCIVESLFHHIPIPSSFWKRFPWYNNRHRFPEDR